MGFHKGMTWNEIEELISDLVHEEETTEDGKNYPLHYTNRGLFS